MTRIVFVDCETTSLDDERGEVWEIGAIVRNGGGDTEHLWQIRPNLRNADPTSLKIGRYYERRVHGEHAPGEAAVVTAPYLGSGDPPAITSAYRVAQMLAEMLDGAHVVGAVPDFDFRFLRRFLRKHNECWTAHYHLIDIEALAVGYLHGVVRQATDQLAAEGKPHDALAQVPGVVAELPWKSTALYRAVGVDPDQFEAHTALGDARLVRAVNDAITGGA
ncbi:3'-5' exonuclease [Nonomuraea sp. KM90]|uniref:3'-5' exonuclease n=1 Tax=Nonomuraea sp. KM90 TaxID=3457428 RepID=UPI003FCCB33A